MPDAAFGKASGRLFLHFPVLKARRELGPKPLRDRQSECLWYQDRRDAFPWLRSGVNSDRQEPLGMGTILGLNQDYSPATSHAIFRERDPESSGPAQGQDDGHVRFVYIQQGPVAKTSTRVESSALSRHPADAQRAHDGSAVGGAAPNDLNVRCSPAEFLHFASFLEHRVQRAGV